MIIIVLILLLLYIIIIIIIIISSSSSSSSSSVLIYSIFNCVSPPSPLFPSCFRYFIDGNKLELHDFFWSMVEMTDTRRQHFQISQWHTDYCLLLLLAYVTVSVSPPSLVFPSYL